MKFLSHHAPIPNPVRFGVKALSLVTSSNSTLPAYSLQDPNQNSNQSNTVTTMRVCVHFMLLLDRRLLTERRRKLG